MGLIAPSQANTPPAEFAFILLLAALFGGALGSFVGVVATRGLSASLGGRSHCDHCGRTLASYELVPFVSYVALRGRCRTCGVRIGWAPLLWELGFGVLAVAIVVVVLVVAG